MLYRSRKDNDKKVTMSINSPRVSDQRLVMYRFSKSRSYSVGSGVAKTKRKAEFQDSEVVSVNSNAPTEVVDRRKVQKGQQEEDMVSTKGFARLDMVGQNVKLYL